MRLTHTDKLLQTLEGLGFKVTMWNPTMGAWRKEDVVRWDAQALHNGQSVHLFSWDTITKCAREDIRITHDCLPGGGSLYGHYEVCAKSSCEAGKEEGK